MSQLGINDHIKINKHKLLLSPPISKLEIGSQFWNNFLIWFAVIIKLQIIDLIKVH
jgi:hypothetical protein